MNNVIKDSIIIIAFSVKYNVKCHARNVLKVNVFYVPKGGH